MFEQMRRLYTWSNQNDMCFDGTTSNARKSSWGRIRAFAKLFAKAALALKRNLSSFDNVEKVLVTGFKKPLHYAELLINRDGKFM